MGFVLRYIRRLVALLRQQNVEMQPASRIARIVGKRKKFKDAELESIVINPLTPIDDSNEDVLTQKRFAKALLNPRVKNVAVTGPYGAGKSSFLRSYFRGRNVLWISLAKFNASKKVNPESAFKGSTSKAGGTSDDRANVDIDEQRLETAILQQLFYSARASELPFSRFTRIVRIGFWRYLAVSALTFLSLFCCGYIFEHKLVFLKFSFLDPMHILSMNVIVGLLALAMLTILIMTVYDSIAKFRGCLRFGMQNVGIEVQKDQSRSCFNQHIDELLYFFSTLTFEAVVFEDIDRFENINLFVKLREMNDLINNSRQVWRDRKPVRFIYAIKDDFFDCDGRVKFFDYILPIIPVISIANSRSVIRRNVMASLNESNLSAACERFVRIISMYITDMRLLNNICNEFSEYRDRLKSKLQPQYLLGLMVFKNYFPTDFSDLHKRGGVFFKILSLAKEKQSEALKSLQEKIKGMKEELAELQEMDGVSMAEVNKLYVANGYINVLPAEVVNGNVVVDVNGHREPIVKFLVPENIPALVGTRMEFRLGHQPYSMNPLKTVSWEDIEKLVGGKSYLERKKLLEEGLEVKIDELKNSIVDKQRQYMKLSRMTIKNLAEHGYLLREHFTSALDGYDTFQISLLYSLFANGYVNEQYKWLLSEFDEQIIQQKDYDFEMSVYNGIPMPYEFKLPTVSEVAEDISTAYFATKPILNFDLFRYLLNHDSEVEEQLRAFASAVFDDEVGFDFLANFFEIYVGDSNLMSKLLNFVKKYRESYFREVAKSDKLSVHNKLLQIGVGVSKRLNSSIRLSEEVRSFIEGVGNVNDVVQDMRLDDKSFRIFLEKTSLKFKHVNFQSSPPGIASVLIDTKSYVINLTNVMSALIFSNVRADISQRRCGSMLISNEGVRVGKYVLEDINGFLDSVYYKIPNRQDDTQEFILLVLNHPDTDVDSCLKFLSWQSGKIEKISAVKNEDVIVRAVKSGKVMPTWENTCHYFVRIRESSELRSLHSDEEIDNTLLNYIVSNIAYFKKTKCPDGIEGVLGLANWLITRDGVKPDDVAIMLNHCRRFIHDLDVLPSISSDMMRALCKRRLVKFDIDLFNLIVKQGEDAYLEYAIVYPQEFIDSFNKLVIDNSRLSHILSNIRFGERFVQKLCSLYEDRIVSDDELKKSVATRISNNDYKMYSAKIRCHCFGHIPSVDTQMLIINSLQFDRDNLLKAVALLRDEYNKVSEPSARPRLKKIDGFVELLDKLVAFNIVSSYDIEGDYVRVNVKRNI